MIYFLINLNFKINSNSTICKTRKLGSTLEYKITYQKPLNIKSLISIEID